MVKSKGYPPNMVPGPPKKIESYVRQFCDSVVKGGLPAYIAVRPEPWTQLNDCFEVVATKVIQNGGKKVFGWAIWEWPKVMIQAEFHCIWESQQSEWIDISPRENKIKRVLFLRDPNRVYEGFQVDNIRQPLRQDVTIDSFISICEQIYTEQNRGVLKFKHGEIPATPQLLELYHNAAILENELWNRYR